ncbi:MAG: hypothetical protein IJX78_02480 [Bacilli bacterium]|nr:hypothetical protein [Bacilli bacterium]
MPDIAKIFEVSIDYLLGYGKTLSDKEWVNMYDNISSFIQIGKNEECLEYLKEMLEKYPDDEKVQMWYAHMCRQVPLDKELLNSAIKIYEKVIRTSRDEKTKKQAYNGLFYVYMRLENKEAMKDVYDKYLKNIVGPDYYEMYFLEGLEKTKYLQHRLELSLHDVFNTIRQLRFGDYYTKEEKNILLKKYLDIMEIMYEEHDYGFDNWNMYETCREMLMRFNELNEENKCLEYIEKATNYAIDYDNIDVNEKTKSKLFNTRDLSKVQVSMSGYKEPGNMSFELINILKREEFDKYKNNNIYISCIERLKKVAKKY